MVQAAREKVNSTAHTDHQTPRAHYEALKRERDALQGEKADCERAFVLFCIDPSLFSDEQIGGYRQRYSGLVAELNTLVTAINELLEDSGLRAQLAGEERARETGHTATGSEKPSPWSLAKPAPEFIAEEEEEFAGFAKDLVVRGGVTLVDAPKGVGKSLVLDALAVALGSESGVFRGEQVRPCRVLLLDRENFRAIVKQRLRRWGAKVAQNLKVLTREQAPDLKDKEAWAIFPIDQYDVVIIDSVGASTEGITEREGKETTLVIALLQDLTHRGLAIVLLQNTDKLGKNIRGRGEWADRADIQFEVRDATGFTPSGKRPWWLELPLDGAEHWAERAARRKGQQVFRLAFTAAKFRLGAEPEPFCLEMALPDNEPWTLRDVTTEILQAGEEVMHKAAQAKNEKLQKAADALAEVVKARATTGEPLGKKDATEWLCAEHKLSRNGARELIEEKDGILWTIQDLPAGRGKGGTPKGLFPLENPPVKEDERPIKTPSGNPHETRAGETVYSAARMESAGPLNTSPEPAKNATSTKDFNGPAGTSGAAYKSSPKSPSNGASESTVYSAADKVNSPTDRSDAEMLTPSYEDWDGPLYPDDEVEEDTEVFE